MLIENKHDKIEQNMFQFIYCLSYWCQNVDRYQHKNHLIQRLICGYEYLWSE